MAIDLINAEELSPHVCWSPLPCIERYVGMPVRFCTVSLKLDLSTERTLMGGFVADLDLRLLTFVVDPPMDVCDDKGFGFGLTKAAVRLSSSSWRGPRKGLLEVVKGLGESIEEGLC